MPIRFNCPHCHHRLSVAARKAGTAATCPHCGQALTIPSGPVDESEPTNIALVYELAGEPPAPAPPPKPVAMIALPVYVFYVQGGLIGTVALTTFVLGVLVGSTLLRPSPP